MIPASHLALVALIDLVWAFNVIAIKFALYDVKPLAAVFARFVMVLLVCLPWMRWVSGRMGAVLLTSLLGGALYFGLGGISFAVADNVSALAIAGQLSVPFSLVLAVIFLGERIHWPRILGVALAFLGIAVMSFDPAIAHERIGVVLTVIAAFVYGIVSLLMRHLKGVHPLNLHAWLALVSLPPLAVASLLFEPGEMARLGDLKAPTYGWLAYSAVGASVIGHAGMSWLFQRHPVSVVAPMTLPTPLLSVIVAVIVLATPLTGQMIVGGSVALVGVTIITLRTARALRLRGEGT